MFGDLQPRIVTTMEISHRHLHGPDFKVLMWGFKAVVLEDQLGSEGIISHADVES